MSAEPAAPAVSVLMTVYNREAFLADAIDCVLAQQLSDWELILVDDQSTDRSFEIAQEYARNDSRIRVYQNAENLGDYPNRNRAASLARGVYLKYVDADDVAYPHCLSVMVDLMNANPHAAFGISYSASSCASPCILTAEEAYQEHFFGSGIFKVGPLSTIIRRQALAEIGGFNEERNTGDFHAWLSLARSNSVLLLPPGLCWWRHHEGQESSLLDFRRSPEAAKFGLRYLRFALDALKHPACPLDSNDAELARQLVRKRVCELYWGLLRTGQLSLAKEAAELGDLTVVDRAQGLWSRLGAKWFAPQSMPPVTRGKLAEKGAPAVTGGASRVGVVLYVDPDRVKCVDVSAVVEMFRLCGFGTGELCVIGHGADLEAFCDAGDKLGVPIRSYVAESASRWVNFYHAANALESDWVCFLELGDQLFPYSLSQALSPLAQYPEAELLVSAETTRCAPYFAQPEEVWREEFFGRVFTPGSAAKIVIRRAAFLETGGFPVDSDSPVRSFLLSWACQKPALITYPNLVISRDGSLFGDSPLEGCAAASFLFAAMDRGLCPLTAEEQACLRKRLLAGISLRIRRKIQRGRFRGALQIRSLAFPSNSKTSVPAAGTVQ